MTRESRDEQLFPSSERDCSGRTDFTFPNLYTQIDTNYSKNGRVFVCTNGYILHFLPQLSCNSEILLEKYQYHWRIQGAYPAHAPKGPNSFVLTHNFRDVTMSGVPLRGRRPPMGNPGSATEYDATMSSSLVVNQNFLNTNIIVNYHILILHN